MFWVWHAWIKLWYCKDLNRGKTSSKNLMLIWSYMSDSCSQFYKTFLFANKEFFRFFSDRLSHFSINYFSVRNKHSSLTTKMWKSREKNTYSIDYWSRLTLGMSNRKAIQFTFEYLMQKNAFKYLSSILLPRSDLFFPKSEWPTSLELGLKLFIFPIFGDFLSG